MNFDRATSYAKQKDSLRKEFETFLASLPGHITLATVTPRDICRFLVFKDKNGKTQIHRNGCKYLGQAGRYTCGCPVRLSYKTVDSYIAESRLKGYLKEMNADNGETLHGFRSGCAITLALTGADLAEIMDHVGWTRRHTALYYMQLAKVLNPAGASARLASNIGAEPSCSWHDINQLKRFVCAFPAVDRGKRSYEQERL
ncbi:hypothetical protein ACROYT_G013375 [Oculina patagonica]